MFVFLEFPLHCSKSRRCNRYSILPSYSYQAALQAKKERTTKAAASFGPKSRYYTNLKDVCNLNTDACIRAVYATKMFIVAWFLKHKMLAAFFTSFTYIYPSCIFLHVYAHVVAVFEHGVTNQGKECVAVTGAHAKQARQTTSSGLHPLPQPLQQQCRLPLLPGPHHQHREK